MPVTIKYFANGQEVTLDQWTRSLQDRVMVQAADQIAEQISALECAEHGQGPTVNVTRVEGTQAQLSVSGCCEVLKTQTEQWLETHGGQRTDQD